MKNVKFLLGLFISSIVAIIITWSVLEYLGVEHGSLITKLGVVFIIVNVLIYLLLLIFYVAHNLFQVYSEKKKKAIGSKFRTRLIVSFLGLVFIPSALLFILSNQLINNSIDTWFSLEVQKPIYDSMDLAKKLFTKERQFAENYARILASNKKIASSDKPEIFDKTLLRSSIIYKTDGSPLVQSAFNGETGTVILSTDEGDLIRAASPVIENNIIKGVAVVETMISAETVAQMESVQSSYNEYIQMKTQQHPIRFLYFLMLTIATLLIIFLALWISLRIAKGITVPIQSLAEATNTVAHGDLSFRINLERDDEIGLLINSFNKMLDDLQESKQSVEKAYKESDRRRLSMETILESINTGVIFLDRSGIIITLNNAACNMLNLDRTSLEDRSHKVLLNLIKSEELSLMVKHLIEKGHGSLEKEIHIHINGRLMELRVYMVILKDSSGNFIGTLVVFDNLTEIVMAQRALAWQEVAKRIAHEIKNPLTPIRLSAERLMKKWNDQSDDFGEVLNRSTKTIVNEVNSLRALVDEFSRFGKMPKIILEPTDFRSIIDEVIELYSNHKEIEIIPSFSGTIPQIAIDSKQIRMALINLIDNAIQAQSARIWIYVVYNSEMDLIRVEIADEGTGINEEDKDRLFFPYFSTKKEGTGLGLAIVNSIVSKHRGYIRVLDNEPKGTRFVIELPVEHT